MKKSDEIAFRAIVPCYIVLGGVVALSVWFIAAIGRGLWLSTVLKFVFISLSSYLATSITEDIIQRIIADSIELNVIKMSIYSVIFITLAMIVGVGIRLVCRNKNYCFADFRTEEQKQKEREQKQKDGEQVYEMDGTTTVTEQNSAEEPSIEGSNYTDEVNNEGKITSHGGTA